MGISSRSGPSDACATGPSELALGEKVRVEWMGTQVEAIVAEQLHPSRIRNPRFFYRLTIPGVKGRPIYEDREIERG